MASLSRRGTSRRTPWRRALAALSTCLSIASAQAADLQIDVRDGAGAPLADMVVYAEMLDGANAARPNAAPHAVIDQIHKQFVPRVTVIQTGTFVDFPNSDNIRHEVYSFSPAKVFTSKLYSGRPAAPVEFDKPGPVALGCNIHDHMLAWVLVVDTPYFAKSGADGSSLIAGLKPGDYRVSVWYPAQDSQPKVQQIHVADGTTRETVQMQAPAAHAPTTAALP